MKIKVTSNFSFSKLYKYGKYSEFGIYVRDLILDPVIDDSQRFIADGMVQPRLAKSTIERRRKRKTPKARTLSAPLFDTGALHDSIEIAHERGYNFGGGDELGIEMNHYGKYHLFGKGVPKRNFIELRPRTKEIVERKITSRFVRSFKKRLSK